MRHFLVVGQLGQVAGLGIEAVQGFDKQESAFQSQDIISNHYGARFFAKYDPALPLDRQLSDFFKNPEYFDRGWKIK